MKQAFKVADGSYAYTYYKDRDEAAETLVFFHGFTSNQSTWSECIEQIQSYHILLIDLPGHGETQLEDPRTMQSFSDDFALLLNYLGIQKINLIGYSLGGRTALSFTHYYPERVERLILESASPGLKTADERKARREKDRSLAEYILNEGIKVFTSYWENIFLFESQKKLPVERRDKIKKERLSQDEKGLAMSLKFMGTGMQPSWWESLETVSQPVLLIVGEQDEKFIEINKMMNKLLLNANLYTIKDVGHAVHIENSQEFMTHVQMFLKDN